MLPESEPIRRPLSELESHAAEWTAEVKQTHRPLMLTVDDTAEIVLQDATSYHAMMQRLEALETERAIQEGEQDVIAGRTIPLEEAMERLRAEFDLHR